MPFLRSFALLCTLALFALGDRGKGNLHNQPTVCNNVPDEPPTRRFARGLGRLSPIVDYEARNTEALRVIRKASTNYESLNGRELLKRAGTVSYHQNCNDPPPASSTWSKLGNDFNTKKKVIQAAYADAVQLAESSKDIAADHKAFTHYFGGAETDVQLEHFKNMMSAIASDTSYYNIQFECSGSGGDCNNVDTAANTDASVAEGGAKDQKNIWICSRFWTYSATKFLITPKDGESPPYRPKTAGGWCNKDSDGNSVKQNQFFATAGHTILHELTHLDSLAQQAGLEAPTDDDDDDEGRHGTDDSQKGCELAGARDFLKDYQNSDTAGSPDYNAESYAAAATEKYFMDLCDFNEIKPLVTTSAPASGQPSDSIPAPQCAGEPTNGPVAFGQADADAKILEYCGNKDYWNTTIVPAVSMGTGLTSDGRHKALGASNNYPINKGDKLYLDLSFSEGDCTGTFQFGIGKTDDDKINHCATRFRTILNGCNTAGLFPKYGGTLTDVCAVYTLTARKGDAPDPTVLKSQGDLGAFVCAKTDVSALGPNSPLANTCTCHYANVPGPYDAFKMPSSGNCKDTDKEALLNNS